MREHLAINKAASLLLFLVLTSSLATPESLGPNDTLAAARLTKQEIAQLEAELEKVAFDNPDSWSAELRARRIELGNSSGLVLEGTNLLCGGTGNCQIFVFRKVGGKWASLFDGQAPIGEGFTFGPGSTNGIKDLTIVANSSAQAESRITYKFDGKLYLQK